MAGGTCPTRSDLILEQRGLREGITEALQDGDYSFNDDAVAEFVLKISRRGTGLDTSYSSAVRRSHSPFQTAPGTGSYLWSP